MGLRGFEPLTSRSLHSLSWHFAKGCAEAGRAIQAAPQARRGGKYDILFKRVAPIILSSLINN